jgi:hypothetical protein
MITSPSIWGELTDLQANNIRHLVGSGRPTNGTSGSGVGVLPASGSTYVNSATGQVYVNTNTGASPVWEEFTGVRIARATYSFAVDGGAQGLITPATNVTIPNKAIIIGGIIDITTAFTSGGSATISCGTSAGSSATSLKAATAVASWTGLLAIVPVFTAATMVKMTAAGSITLTVATADLTAGIAEIKVIYIPGL